MSEVFEGGVSITKKIFKWELHNFDTLFSYDWFVKQQKFTCQVTSSKGVTSKWSVNLNFMEDSEEPNISSSSTNNESNPNPTQYLSLVVALDSTSNGLSFVDAEIIPKFKGIDGPIISKDISGGSSRYEAGKSRFWLIKSIPKYGDIGYLLPTDGTFMVKLEVIIFDVINQSHNEENLEARMVLDHNEFCYRLISSLENNKSWSDVLIISKDGMEYYAQRWILSKRSDVFNAMFTMGIVSDVVNMDDLSGKAVKILLHFIYTGKMAEEWKHPGKVEEVIYLAEKYKIVAMKHYIDIMASKVCTVENAVTLQELVNRIGLKRASSEILKFIREYMKDCKGFLELLNNDTCSKFFQNNENTVTGIGTNTFLQVRSYTGLNLQKDAGNESTSEISKFDLNTFGS